MNRSLPLVLATAAVLVATSPVHGQDVPGLEPRGPIGVSLPAPTGVLNPIYRADALYFRGEPLASFELLEGFLEADPTNYEVLWRSARAAVILGVAEVGSRQQNRWLDPAMELSDRAVEVDPDGIDGLYWRGAAHGRRAMNASPGYATELAQRVYDDAHAILAMDPAHGGAHNLLGKLSFEVMSLSRFERAMGRLFMGNEALSNASWELAEEHLRAAAVSWPDLILFQFDLAQLYRKRGQDIEAREVYRRVVDLPAVHPLDLGLQEQARGALQELGS